MPASLRAVLGSIPVSDIRPDVRLHWAECNLASARKQGDIRPNVTREKASADGEVPLNNGGTLSADGGMPSSHGAAVCVAGAVWAYTTTPAGVPRWGTLAGAARGYVVVCGSPPQPVVRMESGPASGREQASGAYFRREGITLP